MTRAPAHTSRRTVLTGGAAATATAALGLPGAAVAATGEASASVTPFAQTLAALNAAWARFKGVDVGLAEHERFIEPLEMAFADVEITTAEDALAAFEYLEAEGLIMDGGGSFGVVTDAMKEGIREYLATQAGQVAS